MNTAAAGRTQRTRTDAVWAGAGQALSAVAGVAMITVAARSLDKESVAALSWALAIASTLAIAAGLGVAPAAIATLGRLDHAGRQRQIGALASVGMAGALFGGAVWLALGHLAADRTGSAVYGTTVLATAALIPTAVGLQLCEAVARSIGDFRMAAFLTEVVRRGSLIVLLGIAAITASRPDLRSVLLLVPLFEIVAIALAIAVIRMRGVRPLLPDRHAALTTARLSVTFLPAVVMAIVVPQFGIWIGGFTLTTDQVADLALAVRLSFAVNLPFAVLGRTLAPRIARTTDPRDLQQMLRRAARISSTFTVGLTAVLAVAGAPLIAFVFGEEYRSAAGPLTILNIGQSAVVLTGYCGQLLSNSGHQRVVGRVSALSAVAFIGFCFAIGGRGGAVGIAAVAAATQTVANLMLWRTGRRILGVDTAFSLRPLPNPNHRPTR